MKTSTTSVLIVILIGAILALAANNVICMLAMISSILAMLVLEVVQLGDKLKAGVFIHICHHRITSDEPAEKSDETQAQV